MTNAQHPSVIPMPKNKTPNSRDFAAHLSRQSVRTNLQLCRCYFEDELHNRADGQTSSAGRMDLIPNSVTVHLQTQSHARTCSHLLFISLFFFQRSKKNMQLCTVFHLFRGIWWCGLQYFSGTAIVKLRGHLKSFSLCYFTSKLVFENGSLATAGKCFHWHGEKTIERGSVRQ